MPRAEPVPRNRPGLNPVRIQDGPQNVSQTSGSIVEVAGMLAAASDGLVGMLDEARGQLGYDEAATGYSLYGAWYASTIAHDLAFAVADWCDMFLSWCAAQAGLGSVVGEFAYCPFHADWFDKNGRFGSVPHPGDLVFYNWNGDLSIPHAEHVGLVESLQPNGYLVVLEGNTSTGGALTGVRRRVRNPDGVVVGYGSPVYVAPPAPAPVGADDDDVAVGLGT